MGLLEKVQSFWELDPETSLQSLGISLLRFLFSRLGERLRGVGVFVCRSLLPNPKPHQQHEGERWGWQSSGKAALWR